MQVSVAFLPALAPAPIRDVCIVVDVLRASTTLVTMFDRGCRGVVVTPDVDSARTACRPGRLLAGEQGGLPPAGFDFGNSPVELLQLDLAGREVVFCTSNGTVALHTVARAPAVLVGALRNAAAAARAAVALARDLDAGVHVVCAGRGRQFALDDAHCAGAIVARLAVELAAIDVPAELDDAALAALALARDTDPLTAFRGSHSGRHLARLGLAHDVDFCAQTDRSTTVPRLRLADGELLLTIEG